MTQTNRFRVGDIAVLESGSVYGKHNIDGVTISEMMWEAKLVEITRVGDTTYSGRIVHAKSEGGIFEPINGNDWMWPRSVFTNNMAVFASKILYIVKRFCEEDTVATYKVGDIAVIRPKHLLNRLNHSDLHCFEGTGLNDQIMEGLYARITGLGALKQNGWTYRAEIVHAMHPTSSDQLEFVAETGWSFNEYMFTGQKALIINNEVKVFDVNGETEPSVPNPLPKPATLTGNKRVKLTKMLIDEPKFVSKITPGAKKYFNEVYPGAKTYCANLVEYRGDKYPYKEGEVFNARVTLCEQTPGSPSTSQIELHGSNATYNTRVELFRHLLSQDKTYFDSLKEVTNFGGLDFKRAYEEFKAYYESLPYPAIPSDPVPNIPNPQGGNEMPAQNTVEINQALLKELRDAVKAMSAVHQKTALEEKLIAAVIEKSKDIATAELQEEIKSKLDLYIQETYGLLPRAITVKVPGKDPKELFGLFHKKFDDILAMVTNDIPVMLTGPAGVGKNFTLEQIAKALDLDFYYTGAITQEYKLTGFIDAGGHYHETEFYKSFKNGGIFMLDEVDASSPEILVLLNGAIANKYFDFPNGRIKAHEDFRITCAGNTYGTGADMIYVGRNVLDGATLDRFAVISMDYDEEVEANLCLDKEYLAFVRTIRQTVFKLKLRHIVGMRASINGYKALKAGMSTAFVIESIVMKGMSIDDLTIVNKNLPSKSGVWYDGLRNHTRNMEVAR